MNGNGHLPDLPKLPNGWTSLPLGAVLIDTSKGIDPKKYPATLFELYSVPSFPTGKPEVVSGAEIGSNKVTVEEDVVLLCGINPRINRVWIVKSHTPHTKIASTEWICFFKREGIYPEFLMYFLRNSILRTYLASNVSGVGNSLMRIKAATIADYPFPIPPYSEQQRIVAKIEELFTRLDAGIEALKQIKLQLKRYRQAVLKAAFEGKLTQEWREAQLKNPKSLLRKESASALLERITAERKKALEKTYKELPPVDTTDLPDLPEGWVWTRAGELMSLMQYGTSEKADEDDQGIPVLRMGNIQDGSLCFNNLKYYPQNAAFIGDFILSDGDVLFNRTNSAELVGKTAVYRATYPKAVFASYLIRVRTDKSVYEPDVLSWYINSYFGRLYINSVVSQQVGQANVNSSKLAMMPVPLMHPLEQQKIIAEIERCLSIADVTEMTIDTSLREAERLRQSILKQAFKGKLVPQDPNDEPAEKLLERSRATLKATTAAVPNQRKLAFRIKAGD